LNDPNAITASSTGNVDAGSIKINASNELYLDPSGITTTSNQGNGGGISITAGILSLNGSEITTSVTGLTGNGGNITINANSLVMNTGFIQANTAAANASGGTVSISAQSLIPSGNTLFIGGNTPYTFQPGVFGFNVIQAAAPTGVSGTVQTTSPTLDLSSSLSGLNTQQIDTGGLGRSPCQATGGSSLSITGRGGLPPSARGLLRVEPILPVMTSNTSPTDRNDVRFALTDWSCS
jgi:large exoprotein involved in heme utilization and adhesion